MEVLNSFINRQNNMNSSSLLNLSVLNNEEKRHLKKVYAFVGAGVCTAALGVYIQNFFFSLNATLSLIMQFVCFLILLSKSNDAVLSGKIASNGRLLCFGGFAFFFGTTLGTLVEEVHAISPNILPTAFFGSIAIFSCFSLCAIFAKRRSYLYLGSILSSCLMYLSLVSIFNIFFRSSFAYDFVLYASLFIYMGFVIYDTQVTLEDFRRGNCDYLLHALQLYIDLVAIFVRICIILAQREKKKEKNRKD